MDYICHRRRSNTAQRLDRLKKEKITQSKTKTVVWPVNNHHITSTRNQTIDPSEVELPTTPVSTHYPPKKSGLTRLLERFPSIPKNPFDEFAQFDGGMSEILPVKKILIFIALSQNQIQSQQANNNNETNRTSNDGPLEVVIVSTAKVQDLIGLICWQYTNEGREPKLHYDINRYCLRIAEDNGEVDPDFGSLNPKEPLSKFNFPMLALTEKTEERDRVQMPPSTTYNQPYTILPNVVPERPKSTNVTGKITAIVRAMIFKDAKLDENR